MSINDCNEYNKDDELLDDDRENAKDAVREAIDVFSDLKYNFQKSFEDEKDEKHSNIIQNFAMQLDQLKSELDKMNAKDNIHFTLKNPRSSAPSGFGSNMTVHGNAGKSKRGAKGTSP